MAHISKLALLLTLSILNLFAKATCPSQTPFFPPPTYTRQSSEIWEAFSQIEASLSTLTRNNTALNTSSYSIEVTSSSSTLWSTFHTARDKNITRPGAEKVDETSRYRIASITKVFTVLGILQQHAAGTLSLDDPVDRYVSRLHGSSRRLGESPIPWSDITLRSLASQLSGLPRDWAQGDLIHELEDPTSIGLPPIPLSAPEFSDLPKCDSYNNFKPCTAEDLLNNLDHRPALFAPNTKSTYSNIAFEILGLVLANVTGKSYEECIEYSILTLLKMPQTTFQKPSDDVAVLPKGTAWYFDIDEGVQSPTGGLYCSSSDMSTFLRYILQTHKNIADTKLNWLTPVSFTPGLHGFYGMPWEIFRTDGIILPTAAKRTVTFYTKGGGLPGYSTQILLVPEYDLGITIFTAGDAGILNELLEKVTVPLIQAAEELAARQVRERYAGTFSAATKTTVSTSEHESSGSKGINSSITLSYTPTHGLEITNWVSNSTDMLRVIPRRFHFPKDKTFHAQLIPTFLYRDEARKEGEKWRIALILEDTKPAAGSAVWDDFCITDVDGILYVGLPLNEVVLWGGDGDGKKAIQAVELTAFRVNLTRSGDGGESEAGSKQAEDQTLQLLVQEL